MPAGPRANTSSPRCIAAPGECVDLHRFLPGVRLPGERGVCRSREPRPSGPARPRGRSRRRLLRAGPGGPGRARPRPRRRAARVRAREAIRGRACWPISSISAGATASASSGYDEAVRPRPPTSDRSEARAVWALCAALRAGETLPRHPPLRRKPGPRPSRPHPGGGHGPRVSRGPQAPGTREQPLAPPASPGVGSRRGSGHCPPLARRSRPSTAAARPCSAPPRGGWPGRSISPGGPSGPPGAPPRCVGDPERVGLE